MYLYHPSLPTPFVPLNDPKDKPISPWSDIDELRTRRPDLLVVPDSLPDTYQEGIFFLTFFRTAKELSRVAANKSHIYNPLAKIFIVTFAGERTRVLSDPENNPSKSFLIDNQLHARVVVPEVLLGKDWTSVIHSFSILQRRAPGLELPEISIPKRIKRVLPMTSFLIEQSDLPYDRKMSLASITNILLALLPVSRVVRHYDGGSHVSIDFDTKSGKHNSPPTLNLIAAVSRRTNDLGSSGLSSTARLLLNERDDLLNLAIAISNIEGLSIGVKRRAPEIEAMTYNDWSTYLEALSKHIEINPNDLVRFIELADKIVNQELRKFFLSKFTSFMARQA